MHQLLVGLVKTQIGSHHTHAHVKNFLDEVKNDHDGTVRVLRWATLFWPKTFNNLFGSSHFKDAFQLATIVSSIDI